MQKNNLNSRAELNLLFLGGVGNDVTGSSTLISFDVNGRKRYGLVDVGGYQGGGTRNFYFPVIAEKIDFVVITHAHYDHIGLLPKLCKEGFKGKVFITEQAKSQGTLIMQDAANINEEATEYQKYNKRELSKERKSYENKKRKAVSCRDKRSFDDAISQLDEILQLPLYTREDVIEVKNFYEIVKPNEKFAIFGDVLYAKVVPTTHQNGAIQVELYHKNDEETVGVLFSGDIGPGNSLLYENHEKFVNTDIDYAVLESLPGKEVPIETLDESIAKLEKIIRKGMKSGRRIVLSGFSLDRDAMFVYIMNRMLDRGEKIRVVIDAPLATRLTQVYQGYYRQELQLRQKGMDEKSFSNIWFKNLGKNPFGMERFVVASKVDDHIQILNDNSPMVIITASANGSGGRVVDFFEKFIQDQNTVFVFGGWIYPGSPSDILDKTEKGQIVDFGDARYIKRCETIRLHGFSSHGYLPEIFSKLYIYPRIKEVILNHGESDSTKGVQEEIAREFQIPAHIPNLYDAYRLNKDSIQHLTEEEMLKEFNEAISTYNMDYILNEIAEINETAEN